MTDKKRAALADELERIDALTITREYAANRRLELARLTYSTESSGLGAVLDKQRAAYNDHIVAAQGILAAIARDSDLFVCPTCEEHFTSHEATPICSRCKTYKVINVPEETIYCGTCNRGADSVDEDGCCDDCADHFRETANTVSNLRFAAAALRDPGKL